MLVRIRHHAFLLSLILWLGSGGHTSYGGFGLFSRKHGLLMDTVVSAEVVLANGTVVTASNTSNTDLFWVRSIGTLQ